eukprot:CAMPEP_0175702648 /NCGR_PEP_ID=MMETSP0097-20121207/36110_1 /TAXON_ID=311494 /ORGANISM="Alexandrium monilatum, Strain CCMP3105" /LENGTH=86 /DNA_ID=CAMNT_0017009913 /DNA_START=194 /DNA_END=450 /DNA_ORIENTATION=+
MPQGGGRGSSQTRAHNKKRPCGRSLRRPCPQDPVRRIPAPGRKRPQEAQARLGDARLCVDAEGLRPAPLPGWHARPSRSHATHSRR